MKMLNLKLDDLQVLIRIVGTCYDDRTEELYDAYDANDEEAIDKLLTEQYVLDELLQVLAAMTR